MKKTIKIAATFIYGLISVTGGYAYGADYTYDVSGSGDSGYVFGEIEANQGTRDVEGYLILENGEQVHFEGEWVGHGKIEGYDEEGNYYESETD